MDDDTTGQSGLTDDAAHAAEPEIEIVEASASAAHAARQRRAAGDERDAGEEYGAKVRKRIGSLTSRLRTEEQAKVLALGENAQLRAQMAAERSARLGDRATSIGSELTAAEQDLAAAITAGDAGKQAAANRRMAELGAERGQVTAGKAQAEQQRAAAEQQARETQQTQLSPAVQAWIDDGNDWFLTDTAMRDDAIAQHGVALSRGIAPNSPQYFAFINERMRKLHPDHFNGETAEEEGEAEGAAAPTKPVARPAAAAAQRRAVVGANRPAPKITLTKDEADVCKALGITPVQYAAERARLQKGS